jgi:hypothetical protein
MPRTFPFVRFRRGLPVRVRRRRHGHLEDLGVLTGSRGEPTVVRMDEARSKDAVIAGAAVGHEAVVEHDITIRAWPTLVKPMRRRRAGKRPTTFGFVA